MGSAQAKIYPYDVADGALHVAYADVDRMWWVVGKEGSYGGADDRETAVQLARDASSTRDGGTRRIVVHRESGRADYTITRTRGIASSQFFQDEVE